MRIARLPIAAALAALGTAWEPLAVLVLAGLGLALDAARKADAAPRAAAAGVGVMTAAIAVAAGGLVPLWTPAPLLAPLAALPFALPGLLHLHLRRRGVARPRADLAFGAGWLLAEALLVHVLDLPALRIGYAVASTPLGRLAALAGAGTVTAGALLVAAALGAAAAAGPRRGPLRALPALGLLLALALPGALPFPGPARAPRTGADVRVALVQTDVRAADRAAAAAWPDLARALEARSLRAVREASARGATLIVTPETTLTTRPGGPLPEVPTPPGEAAFAVLAGASVRDGTGLRNAVVDLADGGRVRHVKARTVPWFERRFAPGTTRPRPVPVAGLRAGLAICFELLYARDVRRAARDADLLIAVSDAAFAGRSALPHLQLGVARVRAVEAGRPLLFVTATGPSAVLDGGGRTLVRTDRFRPEVRVHDLDLGAPRPLPPYARFGIEAEAFALAAALAALPFRRGVRPLEERPRRT